MRLAYILFSRGFLAMLPIFPSLDWHFCLYFPYSQALLSMSWKRFSGIKLDVHVHVQSFILKKKKRLTHFSRNHGQVIIGRLVKTYGETRTIRPGFEHIDKKNEALEKKALNADIYKAFYRVCLYVTVFYNKCQPNRFFSPAHGPWTSEVTTKISGVTWLVQLGKREDFRTIVSCMRKT